jgi:hypothetical protein
MRRAKPSSEGSAGGKPKARQLIANASYDPDQLKALGKAFDDAWDRAAPHVSGRAEAIEAARLTLADIVLGLAKSGVFDPQKLADAAVRRMLAHTKTRQ